MQTQWTKSSYCVGESTCVELITSNTEVWVRGTENPDNVLKFTYEEWDAFVKGVKNGEFNI